MYIEDMEETQTQPKVQDNKSDEKTMRILFGAGVFLLLMGLMVIFQLLPDCKNTCKSAMTMMEVISAPALIAVAFLASGVIYHKVKKMPEKAAEMDSEEKVPFEILVKTMMTSYIVSLIICIIPSMIFSSIYRDSCSDAAYSECGNGVGIPYLAVVYPLVTAGAVIAGYKLSYLLFVPLSEIGHFPNGKAIMKHTTPKKEKFITLGAGLLAAIVILVTVILFMNSI